MDELKKMMRQAGCSREFIFFVSGLLRNQEIIWNDNATVINRDFVCVRVEEGYRTIEIND